MREIPKNIEAEQNVIGGMILSKYAIEEATGKLNAGSFYIKEHQIIFNAIVHLFENRQMVDIRTVTTYLVEQNQLEMSGGVDYLAQIADKVMTTANINYYIDIVADRALARRVIEVSEQIASEGYENEGEIADYLSRAESTILDVIRSRQTTDFQSSEQVIDVITKKLDHLANNPTGITGIQSGYKYIDRVTNGWQPGDLIILAARPGAGKTAFALNMASNAANLSKKPVGIFSLEMPSEQLMSRIIAAEGRIEGQKLRTGQFEQEDLLKYATATERLKSSPIFIDDTAGIKVSEIASKCRKLERENNGLGLIIIDYLQLITGSGNYKDNKVQEVSEISRSLKLLARELKVPIIALSQLSREVEKRADKRPMLSDLRDSGSIEQDADIVCFLYRDDYYTKEDSEFPGLVEFIIAKHRNGGLDTITLNFEKEINKFNHIDKSVD